MNIRQCQKLNFSMEDLLLLLGTAPIGTKFYSKEKIREIVEYHRYSQVELPEERLINGNAPLKGYQDLFLSKTLTVKFPQVRTFLQRRPAWKVLYNLHKREK